MKYWCNNQFLNESRVSKLVSAARQTTAIVFNCIEHGWSLIECFKRQIDKLPWIIQYYEPWVEKMNFDKFLFIRSFDFYCSTFVLFVDSAQLLNTRKDCPRIFFLAESATLMLFTQTFTIWILIFLICFVCSVWQSSRRITSNIILYWIKWLLHDFDCYKIYVWIIRSGENFNSFE